MPERGFSARQDEALIGVVLGDETEQVVFYFAQESDRDQDMAATEVRAAIELAGAWSDLDWEETARELDNLRHANPPSAPLDL